MWNEYPDSNSVLCFGSAEEKADPSIPLYVLPLYSLLAPEKQAKVRLGILLLHRAKMLVSQKQKKN